MEVISEDKLRYIAGSKGFNLIYVEKDYFITMLMYLLKDVRGLYLKGGTALNKIFLGHLRLSEDLDFAADRPISETMAEIERLVNGSKMFIRLETDKTTKYFVRYRVYYKSYFQKGSSLIIDINMKASILLKPEKHDVPNFYGMKFGMHTLSIKEIVAEKIRALITRNQPRDYFDAYFILKKYDVDTELVRKKTEEAGNVFDIKRVFKNANKIYANWDSDLTPLTNRKLDYITCMKALRNKL